MPLFLCVLELTFTLAFKSLFAILDFVGNMAPVVKWSRPRIVVPICMGSNPIRRPIYNKLVVFMPAFVIFTPDEEENPFEGSSEERAECGVLLQRVGNSEAKHVDTFNASDSRQSHQAPHLKKHS